MNALDWLKKQQAESLRRQALFDARPRVAASQAWSGYADKPGGQRLMVRQLHQRLLDLQKGHQWRFFRGKVLKRLG
jgi:4-alpha-glucanotransferase